MTAVPQLVTLIVVYRLKRLELPYVERVVVIREQGSIEFTPEELGADIVLVDIRCTAIGGSRYVNKKTLPDYGFYGYVTLFGGATVKERIPLDFVYNRVIDFEQTYKRLYCFLTRIELRIRELEGKLDSPDNIPPADAPELPVEFTYRGLPYSKLKVKSVIPAQWNITVRQYTENTGFACRAISASDDPTRGESEYPEPIPIPDPNNYPPGLPEPTDPYPGADPNDFPEGTEGFNFPVFFGLKLFATTGAASTARQCLQDATIDVNHTIPDFGPPPYTIEMSAERASVCDNDYFRGYYIVDSQGNRSELLDSGAGIRNVEIVLYVINPPFE